MTRTKTIHRSQLPTVMNTPNDAAVLIQRVAQQAAVPLVRPQARRGALPDVGEAPTSGAPPTSTRAGPEPRCPSTPAPGSTRCRSGRRPADSTYDSHLRTWILPALGDRSLASLTPVDVRALVRQLTEQLAPSTARQHVHGLLSGPDLLSRSGALYGTLGGVTGLKIGDARVSTAGQDLTAQRNGLAALGVDAERVYVDHGLTGTSRARPGLREELAACRAGETPRWSPSWTGSPGRCPTPGTSSRSSPAVGCGYSSALQCTTRPILSGRVLAVITWSTGCLSLIGWPLMRMAPDSESRRAAPTRCTRQPCAAPLS